jgi:hypothetical protein
MKQLGSQWMDFYETLYLSFFHKPVEEFRVSLKMTRTTGNLYKDQ